MDSNLSRRGRLQAMALRGRLKDVRFKELWASPLGRTLETAQIIGEGFTGKIRTHTGLQEIDYGAWQGQLVSAIERPYRAWLRNPLGGTPPNGESLRRFVKRVGATLDQVVASGGVLGIVTHGGVIRAALCYYFRFPLQKFWWLTVDNVSITEIGIEKGEARLYRFNDFAHVLTDHGDCSMLMM
jgi:broad specificity phosphatase PhoE